MQPLLCQIILAYNFQCDHRRIPKMARNEVVTYSLLYLLGQVVLFLHLRDLVDLAFYPIDMRFLLGQDR